jgi:hypothetical protein
VTVSCIQLLGTRDDGLSPKKAITPARSGSTVDSTCAVVVDASSDPPMPSSGAGGAVDVCGTEVVVGSGLVVVVDGIGGVTATDGVVVVVVAGLAEVDDVVDGAAVVDDVDAG